MQYLVQTKVSFCANLNSYGPHLSICMQTTMMTTTTAPHRVPTPVCYGHIKVLHEDNKTNTAVIKILMTFSLKQQQHYQSDDNSISICSFSSKDRPANEESWLLA